MSIVVYHSWLSRRFASTSVTPAVQRLPQHFPGRINSDDVCIETYGKRLGKTSSTASKIQDVVNSCWIDVAGDDLHPLFEESRAVIASPVVHFRNVGLVVIHTFGLAVRIAVLSESCHPSLKDHPLPIISQWNPLKSTLENCSMFSRGLRLRVTFLELGELSELLS